MNPLVKMLLKILQNFFFGTHPATHPLLTAIDRILRQVYHNIKHAYNS
ncbi:MAG: hypothetical protein WA148_06300 [Actinomycetota bacterium]